MNPKPLTASALLGAAAGIRSMTPPAVIAWAVDLDRWDVSGTPLELLANRKVAIGLTAAAAGEMVVDKLPIAPQRTMIGSWLGRTVLGGAAGYAAAAAAEEPVMLGIATGASAAALNTYLSYRLRLALIGLGLPNPVAGLIGDAAAVGLSILAVSLVPIRPRSFLSGLWRRLA